VESIKNTLAQYGISDQQLNEGWQTFTQAKDSWEKNVAENAEATNASAAYSAQYDKVNGTFKRHWKQSKLLFGAIPEALVTLGVQGQFPRSYEQLCAKAEIFYKSAKANNNIAAKMQVIGLDARTCDSALSEIATLQSMRSAREKESSDAQSATKTKNQALIELDDWMEHFDALARLAFFDNPQQLESLGIFVRS